MKNFAFTLKIVWLAGSVLLSSAASGQEWKGLDTVLRFDVGVTPRAIASEDFNSDGRPDLALANWGSDDVSILLNNGSGVGHVSFADAVSHSVNRRPFALVAADFDGSGGPDIVTNSESDPNQLAVLWNGPLTTADFAAAVTIESGAHWITGLATGDADNDGDIDLALVTTDYDQIDVYHKVRLLTYRDNQRLEQYWSSYDVEAGPVGVALADVDGDTFLDLVTVNAIANSVSVLINKGEARPGAYLSPVHYSFGAPLDFPSQYDLPPRTLAVADVDGDDDLDLLVEGSTVTVFKNKGDGTFATPITQPTAGHDTSAIAIADFDDDGAVDVVSTQGHDISVLFNYGEGTFWPLRYATSGVGPIALAAADFDDDGLPDIATANGGTDQFDANLNQGSNDVSVFHNTGRGRFAAPTTEEAGSYASALDIADLDGDGDGDPVTHGPFHLELLVLQNQGGGAFCTATPYDLEHLGPAGDFKTVGVAAGNLDGNSELDLVATNERLHEVAVFLSDSAGGYEAVVHYEVGTGGPDAVEATDLSGGSGPADIVTANRLSGNLSILVNDGAGAFGTATIVAGHGAPVAILVADLDGENGPDIVTANGGEQLEVCDDCIGTSDVSVFWNQGGDVGNADNWSRTDLAVAGPPTAVTVADLDGDTDLDLVAASPGYGSVSVLENKGGGNFTRTDIQPAGDFFPRSVAAADLDGDERPDIVTGNRDTHDVSVFLQEPDGTFADKIDFAAGTEPAAVAVSDMDGDSDLDVVTANRSGTISVLSNRSEEHRFRFVVLADSRSTRGDCDIAINASGEISDADTCINKTPLVEVVKKIRAIDDDEPIDFAVFTGDMIYGAKSCDSADGWDDTDDRTDNDTSDCVRGQFAAWKEVFDDVDNGLPSLPIYPVFGSHERAKDGGYSDFDAFFDPQAVSGDDTLAYYSFQATTACPDTVPGPGVPSYGDTVYRLDYANATFFVLNNDVDVHVPAGTSQNHRLGPCQQEWLARELLSARPLKFFFHHEPAYGVLSHGETNPNCADGPCTMDANKPERNSYIDLIADDATMLFCGHEHHFMVRKIDKEFAKLPINEGPHLDFGRTFYEVKTGSSGAEWKPSTVAAYTESKLAHKFTLTTPWDDVLHNAPFHFALVDVYDATVKVTVYAVAKEGDNWTRHLLANFIHPPANCSSPLAVPSHLDADRDGAIDSEEEEYFLDPRVVRMATATGRGAALVEVPEGLRIANAENYVDDHEEFDPTTKPAGHFPFGVHQFDVSGLGIGEAVEVVLEFPTDVPTDLTYWYHDPRDGWSELPLGSHDGDHIVTLTVMDGGVVEEEENENGEPEVIETIGDGDGLANGTIQHQGGLVDFSYEPPVYELLFVRGDTNADGDVDLSDAVYTLNHLFLGAASPSCDKTADANDDGSADITDVVYALDYLFRGGPPLRDPHKACGTDPTPDELSCVKFALCE